MPKENKHETSPRREQRIVRHLLSNGEAEKYMLTSLIREQIEATLTQFATVEGVVISINGVTGMLEP